jgi:hypothetical protein
MELTTWLENLGFIENPFYSEPVSADERVISKGFINRKNERSSAEDFAQLSEGKLLILGSVGEGKSSLLNLLQYNAEEAGKFALRIDLLNAETTETFIEALLIELQRNADKIPKASKDILDRKLDDLKISTKRTKKGTKIASSLEGKLGAIVAYVKGRVSGEQVKEEEIEYYIPPRIRQLQGIFQQVLPAIFDSASAIVLCENLEKLPMSEFKAWVKQTINLLPKHILLAATANICELDPSTLQTCYDNFSVPLKMESVNETAKLREFIDGRMANYSRDAKPPIRFDDNAIAALLDRTGGNLRESFRYCYSALQKFKRNVDETMMEKAIEDVDAPRFAVLNETDKKLLSLLSSEGPSAMDDVLKAFKGEEGRDALRKRLDGLATSGLVKKTLVKFGRTYRVTYDVPRTVAKIWTKHSSS